MSAAAAAKSVNSAPGWELVRHINGRPWSRRQVGWVVVSEAREIDQNGEYAADYWTARVEAGRYPLYAFRDCGRAWHSLGAEMPGVIVRGSWWNKRQPGERMPVGLSFYAHNVARGVIEGEGSGIELLPGVEARRIDFEYQGEQKHTHGLFVDGEQV